MTNPRTGAWKEFERRVAKLFKGRRTPLSGSMSGHHTGADVLDSPYNVYVECKWLSGDKSAGAATLRIWDDTVRKAKNEGKIPVLVMHRRGSRVEFAAIPLTTLVMLLDINRQVAERGLA